MLSKHDTIDEVTIFLCFWVDREVYWCITSSLMMKFDSYCIKHWLKWYICTTRKWPNGATLTMHKTMNFHLKPFETSILCIYTTIQYINMNIWVFTRKFTLIAGTKVNKSELSIFMHIIKLNLSNNWDIDLGTTAIASQIY